MEKNTSFDRPVSVQINLDTAINSTDRKSVDPVVPPSEKEMDVQQESVSENTDSPSAIEKPHSISKRIQPVIDSLGETSIPAAENTTSSTGATSGKEVTGKVFSPLFREKLQQAREQSARYKKSKQDFTTYRDPYGTQILRVGNRCMALIEGHDDTNLDYWSLPSDCPGALSESDKIQKALKRYLNTH